MLNFSDHLDKAAGKTGYLLGTAAGKTEAWLLGLPRPLKAVSDEDLTKLTLRSLLGAAVGVYGITTGKTTRLDLANRQLNKFGKVMNTVTTAIILPGAVLFLHELWYRQHAASSSSAGYTNSGSDIGDMRLDPATEEEIVEMLRKTVEDLRF